MAVLLPLVVVVVMRVPQPSMVAGKRLPLPLLLLPHRTVIATVEAMEPMQTKIPLMMPASASVVTMVPVLADPRNHPIWTKRKRGLAIARDESLVSHRP
uniref:Putative secreted protein n=1 Tax=Anopheles darlingi TaxID=43151 RepID=A0A2M4D1V6_ANODA